jgi:hypothetical protein
VCAQSGLNHQIPRLNIIAEDISEQEYKDFILVLERLVSFPFAYRWVTVLSRKVDYLSRKSNVSISES